MLPGPVSLTSVALSSGITQSQAPATATLSWSLPATVPISGVAPLMSMPPLSSQSTGLAGTATDILSPSDGFVLSPSANPFPQKLVNKVKSGQYCQDARPARR